MYSLTHLWSSNVRIGFIWMTNSLDKRLQLTRCCKIFVVGNGMLLAAYRLMYFAAVLFINANSIETVYPHFLRQWRQFYLCIYSSCRNCTAGDERPRAWGSQCIGACRPGLFQIMRTHIMRTGCEDTWSPAYSICVHRRTYGVQCSDKIHFLQLCIKCKRSQVLPGYPHRICRRLWASERVYYTVNHVLHY